MSRTSKITRARWRSPGKVNVSLRIVGRRADGYHLLDSIFVPIDLCDDVAVEACVDGSDDVRIEVHVDDDATPADETNLAARAARALLEECRRGGTVVVELRKRIPVGAGLGGGSSNAATLLRGLNDLLDLGVPPARLAAIGLELGADVPFFLAGGSARVRGVGERVEYIGGWPGTSLIVAVPPVRVSTPWAFARFRERGPIAPEAAATEAAALAAGAPLAAPLLVNDRECVVFPAFPAVAAVKARLAEAGAVAAVMSGSGAAVVGVAASAAAADAVAAAVVRAVPEVRVDVVRPVG
jgi:4-diphosphocytidyl-2-C-methyl-D-erythritol kinase